MSNFVERIRLQQHKIHEETLVAVIKDGHLAVGPHMEKLEQELRDRFNKKHVVLTTNGFSALCTTLLALKNNRHSLKVSTTAAGTCFAMVNAIKAAGYCPEFFDLDSQSAGIHDGAFSENDSLIIAPDHFGRISSGLRKTKSNDTFIIEDAAQSFFSREKVATCADVVTLSFYPTKWVNGVDGGAILLDDDDLASLLRRRVSYADQTRHESTGRHNFSMSNLHAAMALASLELSHNLISGLLKSFKRLRGSVEALGIEVLSLDSEEIPTRFIVRANSLETRDRHVKELNNLGIGASKELFFLCPESQQSGFPKAKKLIDSSYSLPFHPWLGLDDIEKIENAMGEVCD